MTEHAQCSMCRRSYDRDSFRALRFVGVWTLPSGANEVREVKETRQCPCGSSFSVEIAKERPSTPSYSSVLVEHRALIDAVEALQTALSEQRERVRQFEAERREVEVQVKEDGLFVNGPDSSADERAAWTLCASGVVTISTIPHGVVLQLRRLVRVGDALRPSDKLIYFTKTDPKAAAGIRLDLEGDDHEF